MTKKSDAAITVPAATVANWMALPEPFPSASYSSCPVVALQITRSLLSAATDPARKAATASAPAFPILTKTPSSSAGIGAMEGRCQRRASITREPTNHVHAISLSFAARHPAEARP
jgi:hypothetical protein